MKYSYSQNEEDFNGLSNSVEDAILESICEYGGEYDTVFIGEAHQKTIGGYLDTQDIESLLERMAEQAYEECGECSEDWLSGPHFNQKINEPREEREARFTEYKKKRDFRLSFLVDGFKIVLEKWATEEKEQPGFWHVQNIKKYDCKTMKLAE